MVMFKRASALFALVAVHMWLQYECISYAIYCADGGTCGHSTIKLVNVVLDLPLGYLQMALPGQLSFGFSIQAILIGAFLNSLGFVGLLWCIFQCARSMRRQARSRASARSGSE